MSEFRFLPGIPTASANNRLMVTGAEGREIDFTGEQQPDIGDVHLAKDKLANKQLFAEALEYGELEKRIPPTSPSHDWDDVTKHAVAVVSDYIAAIDLSALRHRIASDDIPRESREAAAGGLATVTAFLEVIPRVEATRTYASVNENLSRIAMQSKGFIIEWLGVHDSVDTQLAYALALEKPRSYEELFTGLRFKSRYFVGDGKRVGLDPVKAQNLRGDNHRSHPRNVQPNVTALFGCPARRIIPRMYDSMVADATENGLFEKTYLEERQNLGYDD